MTRRTPLFATHVRLGAQMTDFAGWAMPVRYGSETEEHHAVRTTAGLFDLSHMGEIDVVGPDAAAALDRALVGRFSSMAEGRAKYSMLCDHDGGVLDDVVVYRLGSEHFMVVANASNVAVVHGVIKERASRLDADVSDRSEHWSLIAVQGPAAAAVMKLVSDLEVDALGYYRIARCSVGGDDVLVARTGYTGEDGFEIYAAPDDATSIWEVIHDAGRPLGLRPAGLACRDTLRLEAGMPLYGHELSRAVTPFEVGLGRIVDFDKPDGFAGQEALAARRDADPDLVLVGLRAVKRRSPRVDQDVVAPGSGAVIGRITSGSPSPTLGHPIALAYVGTEHAETGTELLVDVRGSLEPVHVVALPFYSRP